MRIGNILKKGFIALPLTLDAIVFDLIGKAYNIFMAIAGARLLSADAYMKVANKIYIIVGVLMLFVLSYSILRSIIDPDKHLKEELGAKMVQRIVIAVVGLAMTPVLFNLLYQAQGLILESNILGNLFFNDEVLDDGTDPNKYLTQIGGSVTATSLWQAFFYPSEESGKTADEIKASSKEYLIGVQTIGCVAGGAISAFFIGVPVVNFLAIGATALLCLNSFSGASQASSTGGEEITLQEAYARTSAGDSFKLYLAFIDNYIDEGEIHYTFIISTIAGGFCLYAFISFSIDMGVRAAKMAYLQIIAPIPLIMQVIPSNKDMFDKYLKSVKNTFMEVFIRISVVYVVVYIICHLPQLFSSTTALWGNSNLGGPSKVLALALLILGIIAFCRKAPDIISETLNIPKGDMKLGLRDKLAEGGAYAAGGILGAAATSGYRGAKNYKAPNGENKYLSAAKRLGRGVGGFFGAGARASWDQFGPNRGKHEAKDFQGMKDVATRASRAQDDYRQDKDTRQSNRAAIDKKIEEQNRRVAQAEEDYRNLNSEENRKRLANEKRALNDLKKEKFATTDLGDWAKDKQRKIKVWAAGSFDLTLEDAAIKMGKAAGDLQDKLREAITAKGSDAIKSAKKEWDRLEAETVSKYKSGYTEESYNEELRKRIDADNRASTLKTAVQSAASNLSSAKANLDAAKASGDSVAIATAQAAYDAASTAKANADKDYYDRVQEITDAFDLEAKKTDVEFSEESLQLQEKRSSAKKVYEMMADAEIQMKLSKNDADYTSIVANFLRDNADLIQNHPNMTVPIEVDAEGKIVKSTSISEFITQAFGVKALDGAVESSEFAKKSKVTLKDANDVEHDILEYDPNTQKYTDLTNPNGPQLEPGQIAAHLAGIMARNPGASLDIDTGVNRGKSKGKKIKNNLPISTSYREKKNMEREKEGKK